PRGARPLYLRAGGARAYDPLSPADLQCHPAGEAGCRSPADARAPRGRLHAARSRSRRSGPRGAGGKARGSGRTRRRESITMRYIAFLRAINVGGHTVTMDRLRALLEGIGLRNVSTFIASGNVLFESSLPAEELERKMAEHLERSLGYEVRVFLRTPDELRSVLERLPFSEAEARDGKVHVCFLPEAPGPQAASEVAPL